MADTKDLEVSPPPEVESPADFLNKLAVALRETQGVDIGLAEILGKHLLTAAPAPDAVALAKAAILKLAADRANPATCEAGHA
jgi:hypothetical protein